MALVTMALAIEQATSLWIMGAMGVLLCLGFAVYHRRRMRQSLAREFELKVTIERKSHSEARYRELFENATDAVLVTDLSGNITELNRKAEVLIGYEGAEARQVNLRALLPDGAAGEQVLGKWLAGQTEASAPIEIRNRSGERVPIEVNTRIIEEGGHPRALQAIARDVRERVALERQLRQSQKMEAVGQLAGGVAHDFNNLLTVIRGNAALVLAALPAGTLRADVQQIDQAADRASVLTRQLLAFSRQEVVQPRKLELNEVLRGVQGMLQRLIGEDYLIQSTFSTPAFISADPGQIEQVLLNLVVNARDAMPNGGVIRWETSLVAGADQVRLSVSDTGVGMDCDTQARIFEPFYTTKELGKGTGLGLSTVFGIVQQLGGQIECVSAPGAGTTFIILLPRVASTAARDPGPTPAPTLHGGTETILLAEDDDAVRTLASRVLRSAGYTVLETRDGQDALNVAHNHPYHIDLLLSDVVMPGMDGLVLSRRLSMSRPSVRVILMSGYTDDEILRRGLHQPGCAYLQKPFTPDSLAAKVRTVLDETAPGLAPSDAASA